MRRVFLLEQPRVDIRTAKRFGELIYLFEKNGYRAHVFDSARFGADVLDRLRELEFDASVDLFCCAGAQAAINVALIAIASAYPDCLNILLFDARESCYVERQLGMEVFCGAR